MIDRLIEFLLTRLGLAKLNSLLSKIPFNGKKTLLCGLATVLAVLAAAYNKGVFSRLLQVVLEQGGSVGLTADEITMLITSFATLLAILHKFLKWLQATNEARLGKW